MKGLHSRPLRIVVLAAGFSTRLGRSKAFARIGGISLLRRALLLAVSLRAAQLIAVVPPRSQHATLDARNLGVVLIANRRRHEGLSSSVRCGLGKSGPWSGLLLLPVDLALLRRGELASLISRWRGCPRHVWARRVGRHGGVPLILPRCLKAQALRITGDVGLRDFLEKVPAQQRRLVELPSAAFDVDTRENLGAARARARQFMKPSSRSP